MTKIFTGDLATVRTTGLLRCDCGHTIEAHDFQVGRDRQELICPRCHRDLFGIDFDTRPLVGL